MSEIEISPEVKLNEEEVRAICQAIQEGLTPAQAAGTDPKQLEALYSLGHGFFTSGQYQEAQTIFQALCLYDYRDERFWMGLGASLQAQNRLAVASEVYGMAALTSSLGNPVPLYYAALCQLKDGDLESAEATLSSIKFIGSPEDPQHAAIYAKADNLLEIVRERLSEANQGAPKETEK
ncbi:MAG: SycD/LcrH family type III secretion system chaperone [Deltaproteobacteria bacterium]|jgi:type III secretion system low calcium response chaperone LcrH/SycD|nr:SycD/LcrH family type III secretion system chaperone [Deltaproteobacteria bacterium]